MRFFYEHWTFNMIFMNKGNEVRKNVYSANHGRFKNEIPDATEKLLFF